MSGLRRSLWLTVGRGAFEEPRVGVARSSGWATHAILLLSKQQRVGVKTPIAALTRADAL